MRKVRLGQTELMVSEVGFGGIPIQRLTEEEAVRVIRHCMDLGVTFIDTAHVYGTSEERIGKAIAGRRDEVILASKSPGRDTETFRQHMEQSFERLDTDYIDLYQFHNVSTEEHYRDVMAPGGPMEVAQKARAAGRIGHIGVTSHTLELAVTLAESDLFETVMFPFNFVINEPAARLLPACEEHDVGFIAMKPMAGGMLDDAWLPFRFLQQHSGVLPLVGIQRESEMDEIVEIMAHKEPLTDKEASDIRRLREKLGTRFCRACGYCLPCPQEIEIPMLMRMRAHAKRFPQERFYGAWGQEIIAAAETCLECGDCEERCPYDLPIRELIVENVAWYQEVLARHQRTH